MSMALSLGSRDDTATDISNRDLIFAAGLHLLVAIVILIFGTWHSRPDPEIRSVTVNLISKAELDKAMRHHAPKHVAKQHHHKPAPKPKPVPQHKAETLPALQKHKPTSRPKPKPAPKKAEEPFDPFQPLASSSDKASTPATASTSEALQKNLAAQLSTKEMDRYHAMIVKAIEENWKVPAIGEGVQDPRVEMTLNPDGSVQRVDILESSGNAALDASLVRAIRSASPFIIPRQQYQLFRTMRFRFHPLR